MPMSRVLDDGRDRPQALAGRPRRDRSPAATVLRLQRAAGNRATRAMIQRIDDEDLEELLADKKNKEQYTKSLRRYNANFVDGQFKGDNGVNDWDYLKKKAKDLKDLDQLVTDEIDAARRRAASRNTAQAQAPAPAPQPVTTTVPSSSQVVMGPPSSAATQVAIPAAVSSGPSTSVVPPQSGKKKKPKYKPADPNLVFGASKTKQQVIDDVVNATNPDVLNLIANKPSGAVRVVGNPQVSVDTVYFDLTVTLPVDTTQGYPRRRIYQLEIHLHPVPTTQNYLHVKLRPGTSPRNIVQPGNWLVDRAKLNAGKAAWNAAYPSNPSTLPQF